MTTILKTQGLNKVYQLGSFPRNIKVQALNDVNLTIESDKPVIVSLVGESGSGKTTLAKVILRLVQPSSGAVTVAGHTVAGKGARPSQNEFLRTVQPIFQNPFEAFSQYRTVNAYLYETAVRVGKLRKDAAHQAVEDALAAVGMEYNDVRGKYPNQFSGGELAARFPSRGHDSASAVDRRRRAGEHDRRLAPHDHHQSVPRAQGGISDQFSVYYARPGHSLLHQRLHRRDEQRRHRGIW